jgi:hypothetical protein
MAPTEPQQTTLPEVIRPEPVSWQERLRQPLPWIGITFVISQILEKAVTLFSPGFTETLRELNTRFTAGVKAVQPWHGVALFWEKLTTNWPDDLSPLGIPFFLLGRAIGGGLEVILLLLSNPETAIPTVIGYGLGLYIVWAVWARPDGELNLFVGIVGTILVGSLCLMVLQPLMLVATAIFASLLGTVSGGVAVLASIPVPLGRELFKHILENRAEARLEEILAGSSTPHHDPPTVEQQSQTTEKSEPDAAKRSPDTVEEPTQRSAGGAGESRQGGADQQAVEN